MASRRILRFSLPFGGASLLARRLTAALPLLLALAGLQCVQDFLQDPVQPVCTAAQCSARVIVAPAGVTVGTVGGTAALRATVLDDKGVVVLGRAVQWASLNPFVASVDSTAGIVTGVGSGQAIVSATAVLGDSAQPLVGYAVVTVAAPTALPVGGFRATTGGMGAALNAVWGAHAQEVFAVGDGGTILRRNTADWAPMTSGTGQRLWGVWGLGAGAAFAVGDGGTILRLNDGTWAAESSGTTRILASVWGASPREVFAVGEAGTILRSDGVEWRSDSAAPSSQNLRGVWGTSAENVYAVGDAGTVLRYDGESWSAAAPGTDALLTSVWGTGPQDVYVGGADGTVLHYDGSVWSTVVRDTTTAFWAVWGASSREVYAAGAGGVMWRWYGDAWTRVPSAGTGTIRGLWGSSAGEVLGVGSGGAIVAGTRGGPTRLALATMPMGGLQAGVPFAIEVHVLDASGRLAKGASDRVRISLGRAPAGAALYGTTFVAADSGVARFTGLRVTLAGSDFSLVASADGLGPAQSPVFGVAPAPLWGLRFATEPADTVRSGRVPFAPALVVTGQDSFGNQVPLAVGGQVRLGLAATPQPDAWLLNDSATVSANGAATFDSLMVTRVGAGFRLRASATGVHDGTSRAFVVVPGPPGVVVVDTDEVVLGAAGATHALSAQVLDADSNRINGMVPVWASTNPAVATVDAAGVVRAVASGQCAVAVSADSVSGYATVTAAVSGAAPVITWTAMPSGIGGELFKVWAYSGQLAYASGASFTANNLLYDGTRWSSTGVGNDGVASVAGIDSSAVFYSTGSWVVVQGLWDRFVLRYRRPIGFNFNNIITYVGRDIESAPSARPPVLWVASPVDIVFASNWGWVSRITRGVVTPLRVPLIGGPTLIDVWGTGPSRFWAVGSSGTIQLFDKNRMVADQSPGTSVLLGVWGASATDVFAVGAAGAIYRYNGTAWTPMTSGTTMTLNDVWGTSATDVYAVGDGGTILRFDGTTWARQASGTTVPLYGIHGAPTGEVFVVGSGGTILRGTR